MRGVALHRFHQVGDQVVAALELHVDIGPRVVTLYFEADQAVVHADDENHGQDHNRQKYPDHVSSQAGYDKSLLR